MKEDADAYRAVITTTWEPGGYYPEGLTLTRFAGPFGTRAAAKARITTAEREAEDHNRWNDHDRRTVDGRIQRATGWEDVPADDEQGGEN